MRNKLFKNIGLISGVILVFAFFIFLLNHFGIFSFLQDIENKTFDLRQKVISKYKTPNKDIVIIAIDDPSYEYIISKYGAWPAPRDFWANMVTGVETVNPKAFIFDLLFVQNFKAFGNSDKRLSDVIIKNKNVYTAINFDNYDNDVRTPIDLPEKLNTKVVGNKYFLAGSNEINFKNVRPILSSILNGTDNIGFINIPRDRDGVLRGYYPLAIYKNNVYKHMSLLAGMDYLNIDSNTVEIDKKNNIVLSDKRIIPLNNKAQVYLNWYGKMQTYTYYPAYKVYNAIKNNDKKYLEDAFKNKIVYVGTTATSLADVKTVPLDTRYPGVETHATFLNNLIDNNFIKRSGIIFDAFASLILAILTALIVTKSKSVLKGASFVSLLIIAYALISILLMHKFNLWVGLTMPVLISVLTVTISYAIKYIITSRDYEHTYKLAVTDGLTEMYNHRYFQEQMKLNVDHSKRYGSSFSLIMIDIDFFKKFNDKYGHQSGDAVLRQVAQTIRKNIRSTDIPCRYGGEEMAVILTNTAKNEAQVVAQKICEAVREREFELATGDYTHVTVSLGVAEMPLNADNAQGMIEYADKCLYIAKANGRNQVVFEA